MSIEFTLYKNIKPYIHAKNYIEITYVNFLHVFLLPKKNIKKKTVISKLFKLAKYFSKSRKSDSFVACFETHAGY